MLLVCMHKVLSEQMLLLNLSKCVVLCVDVCLCVCVVLCETEEDAEE